VARRKAAAASAAASASASAAPAVATAAAASTVSASATATTHTTQASTDADEVAVPIGTSGAVPEEHDAVSAATTVTETLPTTEAPVTAAREREPDSTADVPTAVAQGHPCTKDPQGTSARKRKAQRGLELVPESLHPPAGFILSEPLRKKGASGGSLTAVREGKRKRDDGDQAPPHIEDGCREATSPHSSAIQATHPTSPLSAGGGEPPEPLPTSSRSGRATRRPRRYEEELE
jgi:hypothetical protein